MGAVASLPTIWSSSGAVLRQCLPAIEQRRQTRFLMCLSDHKPRSLPAARDSLGTKEPTLFRPQSKASTVIRLFPSQAVSLYHDSWPTRPPVQRGQGSGRRPRWNGANRGKMRGKRKFNRRSARGLRLSPWCEPIPYNLSALRRMHPEPVRGPEPVQDAFVPYSFPRGNEWSGPASLLIIVRP